MSTRIVQVDAFASTPFTGNPAAVCVLDGAASDTWMQSVALEMNLSETAFLFREGDVFRLRWFTPTAEVALCGHATLASAHVLWQDGYLRAEEQARFQTLSGLLTADREASWIKLDFPADVPGQMEPPPGLFEGLGITRAVNTCRGAFDYIVELDDEEAVRRIAPDMNALQNIDARGIIVTARGGAGNHDFVSRFFGPAVGVPEDPVTGSAHCALAPYWAEKLGRNEMTAYQASARGGVVKVAMKGDRVWLYGQAVTVLTGELHLSPDPRA